MAKSTSNNKPNQFRPNLWGMISNVIIAAINKGQIIPLALLLSFIIFMFRIPADKLSEFGTESLNVFEKWHILGWVITFMESLAGFYYIKRIRTKHNKEIERMSDEKTKLQELLLKTKLGSSKKH